MEGIIRMRKLFLTFLFASLAVTGARADDDNVYYCALFPTTVIVAEIQQTDDDDGFYRFLQTQLPGCEDEDIEWSNHDYPTIGDPFPGSMYTSGGADGYNLICAVANTCDVIASYEIRPVISASQCAPGQVMLDLNNFDIDGWVQSGLASLLEGGDYNYDDSAGVTNFKICVDCVGLGTYKNSGDWENNGSGRQRRAVVEEAGALVDAGGEAWYTPYSGGCPNIAHDYDYQCIGGYYVASGTGSSLSCSMCPESTDICTNASCTTKARGTTDAGLPAITDCCVPIGTYYSDRGKYHTNQCCPYVL